MIQIYDKKNTGYDKNGNEVLTPEVCEINAELNGPWSLSLTHPIDEEEKWKYLQEGAVVAVPSFISEKQLFRIYKREKADTEVNVWAHPIFLDAANELFMIDTRPTDKTGQEALDIMLSGQNRYKAKSNIKRRETSYYVRKNFIEAVQSDDENSFLNRWGGEVAYNNYTIYCNERIGSDYGARAEMGYNCIGISEEVDMTDVVTRIVPVAFNGHTIQEKTTPWIDSPLIDTYPVVYTRVIEFNDVKLRKDASDGDEENGITICETVEELQEKLKELCKQQYDAGIDKPSIGYSCDMEELEGTEEYGDVIGLEKIGLGDTVHCKNKRLDITTEARVIAITYDCIKKKNKNVELGKFLNKYVSDMTSIRQKIEGAINADGTVKGDMLSGLINGMKARLYAMSSKAQKQDVIAMLFEDTDPDSETHGAMALGTCGFMIADRMNASGTEWEWSTFGTGKGFVADYIIAGTMLADRIRGGTLELGGYNNKDGVFWLKNADGKIITVMDNAGVYSKGHYVSDNAKDKYSIDIYNGTIDFADYYGHHITMRPFSLSGSKPGVMIHAGTAETSEYKPLFSVDEEEVAIQNVKKLRIVAESIEISNGSKGGTGKTGRAEFSDGTYIQVVNGNIVGGSSLKGGVF